MAPPPALLRFLQFSPEPVAMGFMLDLHHLKRHQNASSLRFRREVALAIY
jgi:hypothetical protein